LNAWFERALWLRHSPNASERESVLLGSMLADGSPLLVHRKTLSEHVYLRGSPGSGKSAALALLIEQILSFGDSTVHIFDLKDNSSLELLVAGIVAARRLDRTVRVRRFTVATGRSTHGFALFRNAFWRRLTPVQKAGLLGVALGATHGLDAYATQWFGGAAFKVLLFTFQRYPDVGSWRELAELLERVINKAKKDELRNEFRVAGMQVWMDVDRLAQFEALNPPPGVDCIDLAEGFAEPQVIYWSFPGVYDMAGAFFRLALFALFEAAGHCERSTKFWVEADEFQRGLSKALELVFQQAREKVHMLLANQCLNDLKTREKDFGPTVQACCRVHWTFNASDPAEQQFLSETSGRVVRLRRTDTTSLNGQVRYTTTHAEVETDRYTINDIKLASAHPQLSVFLCTQDYGFMQHGGFPQIVHTDFHITKAEYERRKAVPWPGPEEGTFTADVPPPLPPLRVDEEEDDTPPDIVNGGDAR
jgi:hypothetical protein